MTDNEKIAEIKVLVSDSRITDEVIKFMTMKVEE